MNNMAEPSDVCIFAHIYCLQLYVASTVVTYLHSPVKRNTVVVFGSEQSHYGDLEMFKRALC